MQNPFASPDRYASFIYQLPEQYSSIQQSSLVYIPLGAYVGKVSGLLGFKHRLILCVQEFLNFELQVIEGYGYELSQNDNLDDTFPDVKEYCRASYPHKVKLYWYDSFPHPNDPTLAATHPHHKHIPPNIKRHRIPAPDLTFTAPNLPFLIREIEETVLPSL